MFWVKVNLSVDLVKSGQLTNIVDSVSTTNQQNLSTIKNVDLRKSHPHQQNWSIVQIVDSLLDPNQQSVSLKIGETTKCTLGFFLHNNKFVDQQSGSNVQIVVSGPTSTNCVIPNLPRGSRQLYHIVGATPLVDSGPSNLLIRWPTLLIRWPTLLFRDPLCWFGFPLCWCGSTQLEKWESESGHRPECWFGSCLESTFWSMPKHRIYKVGHIYNLHGPRINKICHV